MNDHDNIREHVLKLMKQKENIENEIRELSSLLSKNGVGMNDPLVDEEGFPVNSIDIYQVRHARHRIICLQNDHKNIMAQIENGLHDYYSIFSDNDVHESPMNTSSCHTDVIHVIPFARVTLVSEESPSKDAGIQANDEIVEFGSVNSTNFKDITDIALVVQHSEGNQISVKLKRGDHFRTVVLVPKKWSGKGLLGCNIVAL